MMRWVLLVVLVVAVSAAIPLVLTALPTDDEGVPGLVPASTERKGPIGKAEVNDPLTHDFGVMAYGDKGKKTWTIKNVGEGPLELLKGSSTCQCTVANFEKDPKTGVEVDKLTLNPGETHDITVSWTPKGRGEFHKETSIETNDPETPVIWFKINGQVSAAIMTVPDAKDVPLGRVPNGEGMTTNMAIGSPDRPETTVEAVKTSRPELLEVEVLPLDEEELKSTPFKKGYKLNIKVKPTDEVGDFREEVVVTTDHPQMKTYQFTVSGRLEGPISVAPSDVRIPDATSSDGGKRSAVLSVTDHRETHFEVASKPEGIEVEIQPAEQASAGKARVYKMTVSVAPGTPPGVIHGEIAIKTDHPGARQLGVSVQAVVLSGK